MKTIQIAIPSIMDAVHSREHVHAQRVAGEIAALVADGATLAVQPFDAGWVARVERLGGIVDLASGAVTWPDGA